MKQTIRKILSVVLAMLLLFTAAPLAGFVGLELPAIDFTPRADAATSGYYTYSVSNGKATITRVNASISGDITIPSTLGGYPVTSIGSSAFSFCHSLTSITIPDSVTSIGDYAFSGCESLTSVTIPDSVTSIGGYAFNNTAYYKNENNWTDDVLYIGNHLIKTNDDINGSYVIKNGTKTIAGSAFYDCDSLTSVSIPDSVTSIGDSAFSWCTSLTSVSIGDSVTSIGDDAFSRCTSLTSVTIPDSVTSIGSYAFEDCTSLTSVTIPDSVTSIGDSAFSWCTSLTSVTIPDSVTSIGEKAFEYCGSLSAVYITDIAAWCNIDFKSVASNPLYYAHNLYLKGELITELTIPDSVTSIGGYAFKDCISLTSVTILNPDCSIDDSSYTISETATIIGYANSTAESYARGHSRTFEILTCEHEKTVAIPAVPATCTKTGLSAGVKCALCKTVLQQPEITPATGHSHTATVTAPTCTQQGYTTYTCECGDTYTDNFVPETGHSYSGAVTTQPTHLTDGVYTYKCANCGDEYTQSINKLPNHTYFTTTIAPTCKNGGYTIYMCACGDNYTGDFVSATGHTWDEGVITKEPTATEDGEKTFTCTVCGETKTETVAKLPAFTDSETLLKKDENIIGVAGATAAELLAQAGDGASLVNKDGNAISEGEKVGTGAVLTLTDGTQIVVVVQGDIDGDGNITSSDARSILRFAVNLDASDSTRDLAADTDCDSNITSSDARSALRASVGLDDPAGWIEKIK